MLETSATRTYGDFNGAFPASNEYLTLHFSPTTGPRNQRWRNYGLSADFLGDYFATFFPGNEEAQSKINLRNAVKGSVSFMANELLENAVKYNDAQSNRPIQISLHLFEAQIIFQAINYSSVEAATKYESFIQELNASDPEEMYNQRMEKIALGGGESCIGILTMINDYGATFAWQFQSCQSTPQIIEVNVMASLQV
ncbi:slr1658 superfamily regulator [Vacuolonema iberomarrocanum]|uniref:slr1658 superfamily regulator n=1 Tax=Vacuolonema iberomarrocanum TaxID=3454632 RepID=UPI0019ED4FFD|nr:ATP-binding protein [filamentous cyanobacterium LEGE 07170]